MTNAEVEAALGLPVPEINEILDKHLEGARIEKIGTERFGNAQILLVKVGGH